jgi:hypothetical protein
MEILEYSGLDTSRCLPQYEKVIASIAADDFRSAEVKKLSNITHGRFYRAKLDYRNRLLFSIVRYADSVYALMLEVIENHAYDKSRFLRGAVVDENKLPPVAAEQAVGEAEALRYVHPERREIHLLDKFLSFDDVQEQLYRLPAPLVLVGPAGSGKTALTLEKLKHAEGEVLYVTNSSYLAENARDLYYCHGFKKERQEATFFSFREFVESIRVPAGTEAGWLHFSAWFSRMRQQFKGLDPHQAFEEVRGVITADASGVLSRQAYRDIGIRQSIFAPVERDQVYDLFELYRQWLADAKCYDLNLVSHQLLPLARPHYDFVVIDEIQDLTTVQLALILRTLKKPSHFLLCGDSNQIVHPNFFSWSKVKTLFWKDAELAARQEIKVLRSNFRNGSETTRRANTLLKIKHRRFGSIDRESNFLVDAIAGEAGSVTLLNDKDSVKNDLNRKTAASANFAVLVMRDEDKSEARNFFKTPLLFSIHEAKGLEYENIILYRFISDHRNEFTEIAQGVKPEDLVHEELTYSRGKDKSDKSLEVYKFYVNALYVALTRAVSNVYLIESDTRHQVLALLDLKAEGDQVAVKAKASTLDDWKREARKLELQGKQEQADAIRKEILKEKPVPWTVFDEAQLRGTVTKVFRDKVPGAKLKQQLYDFSLLYDEPILAWYLAEEAGFQPARKFPADQPTGYRRHVLRYYGNKSKDTAEILRHCEEHGVDHRTEMNLTPLMAAAIAGNLQLIENLLEKGGHPEQTDAFGRNALHWAMLEAFKRPGYAREKFPAVYELIAPSRIDVMAGERLIRIDRHQTEYFVFQTLLVLFKDLFRGSHLSAVFNTTTILDAWEHLPSIVLKPSRNTRQHLSNVLSRNEVSRDYAFNRSLFKRLYHGWYQLNPELSIRYSCRDGDSWVPIYKNLNLTLVKEFAQPALWDFTDQLSAMAGLEKSGIPAIAERRVERLGKPDRFSDVLEIWSGSKRRPTDGFYSKG